jgi:phage tail sheath protein FI
MSFFHGITITETLAGGVSIQSVKAAVIGLVGSAPSWDVQSGTPPAPNQPFLVNSKSAQSMLGPMI